MDPYITNLESHTFLRGLSLLSQYEWYIRRCGLERSSWEVIFLYFSWRNDHVTPILFTYGGCEILHHQKDGWNPKKKGMFLPPFSTGAGFCNHPPYVWYVWIHHVSWFAQFAESFSRGLIQQHSPPMSLGHCPSHFLSPTSNLSQFSDQHLCNPKGTLPGVYFSLKKNIHNKRF